ncbi:MAG: tetratricopeptide repeat protein [Pseudomonadota bacterium]
MPRFLENIVPFLNDEAQFLKAARARLARGELTPDNLVRDAVFDTPTREYLAVYRYRGSYSASWTASFGYDKQVRYLVRYDDKGQPIWGYRTDTTWRPCSGTQHGNVDVSAAADSYRICKLNGGALITDLSRLPVEGWTEERAQGIYLKQPHGSPDTTYETHAKDGVLREIDRAVKRNAQGDRQADWHWSCTWRSWEVDTVYVPVWSVNATYEGKTYAMLGAGAGHALVSCEDLPIDKSRQAKLQRAFFPLQAAVGTAALAFWKLDWSWGLLAMAVTGIAVAWAAGHVRRSAIQRYSYDKRQAYASASNADPEPSTVPVPWAATDGGGLALLSIALVTCIPLPWLPAAITWGAEHQQMASAAEVGLTSRHVDRSVQQAGSPADALVANNQASPSTPSTTPSETVAVPQASAAETAASATESTPVAVAEPATSPVVHALTVPTPDWRRPTRQYIPAAFDPVEPVLRAAMEGNWDGVDALIAMTKGSIALPSEEVRAAVTAANDAGIRAIRRADNASALEEFARALALDPNASQVAMNYASTAISLGRVDDASKLLVRVAGKSGSDPRVWLLLSLTQGDVPDVAYSSLAIYIHLTADAEKARQALSSQLEGLKTPSLRDAFARALGDVDLVPHAVAVARAQ